MKYEFDEFICLLDVLNSVYDEAFADESLRYVLKQVNATIYSLRSFSFYLNQNELEPWRKQKPIAKVEVEIGT